MFLPTLRSCLVRKPMARKFRRASSAPCVEVMETRVLLSSYSVQWLGTTNPADNYSSASAINDNGQVVGTSGNQLSGVVNGATGVIGPYQAFSWTSSGGMTGLGTLSGSESSATAVNNNGLIAGIWHYYTVPYTPNGGGYYEWAFYNQKGQMGTIPGHAQIGGHSTAQGVNDAGVIVGNADPLGQAYKFDGSTFTTLGALGGKWSYAMDINNTGVTAGFADTGTNPSTQPGVYQSFYHACLWTPSGTIKDIGTLGQDSYATKINDSGMVVGYSVTTDAQLGYAQYHPFLYNGTTMIDIGARLGGNGFANAINNQGQVVGGSGNPSTNTAWIYENGKLTDLNTLIPAGVGSLTNATDINNKGQIVGVGIHNGHSEAFLLNPSVTAPASPTISVNGGSFVYDTMSHTATATAVGADGVTPVNGTFSFTYNGSTAVPVNVGTYPVVATFVSADPNYANATGTGTLTITPASTKLSVNGGTFTYDGMAHAASATATGVGGAVVAGALSFTYNGLATVPVNAGTYSVGATFVSADPNYASVTASGSLSIGKATPVFSNLSSPTVAAGTASVTLGGHLAAGAVVPAGDSVTITVNGVSQNTPVNSAGDFSASFSTGTLAASSYAIVYTFGGDATSFAAAGNGAGKLTVTAPATSLPTRLTLTESTAVSVPGQTVTFTANIVSTTAGASVPTGRVVFKDGNTVLGTARLVNGTATLNLPFSALGNHVISASYSGDKTHLASVQTVTHTVKAAKTIHDNSVTDSLFSDKNTDWFSLEDNEEGNRPSRKKSKAR